MDVLIRTDFVVDMEVVILVERIEFFEWKVEMVGWKVEVLHGMVYLVNSRDDDIPKHWF